MTNETQIKIKKRLFGVKGNDGLLLKILLYVILIGLSFIFIYPLLGLFAQSLMSVTDLLDPTIIWIPSDFNFNNYVYAFTELQVIDALKNSLIVSTVPTVCAVVSSSLIGYGFARYDFPGKKILFAIMIAIFLIPNILMAIPTYVMYNNLELLNSLKAFYIPALFGFGLRQTLFILIFYQFFRMIPKELFEAAEVDGAGPLRIFFTIAIPITGPAFLITSLYSFVWYWNETQLAVMYFPKEYVTLPRAVENFKNLYDTLFPSGNIGLGANAEQFNQAIQFAGTIISIVPLLLIYLFAQRWFIEGIDRSGITGS